MQELINEELMKMQEQLQLLDSAVKQISKAETISNSVVNACKNIPSEVEKGLNNSNTLYKKYTENLYKETTEKISSIKNNYADLAAKTKEIIKELKKQAENTNSENEKRTQKVYADFLYGMEKKGEEQNEQLSEIKNKYIETLDQIKNKQEQFAETLIEQNNSRLKSMDKVIQQSKYLTDIGINIAKIVQQVELPARLNDIEKKISELHNSIQLQTEQIQEDINFQSNNLSNKMFSYIENVDKKMSHMKKINITMFLVILIMLAVFILNFFGN